MPRRSLCCRTIPKSPSFSRRPSQTNTFIGVRSRCSVCPRWSVPSTSECRRSRAVRSPQASPCPTAAGTHSNPRTARTRAQGNTGPDAAAIRKTGKHVEHADRARCPRAAVPEIRLAQPAVDSRADLDADNLGNGGVLAEPPGQVAWPEAALSDQLFDPVDEAAPGLVSCCASSSSGFPDRRVDDAVRVVAEARCLIMGRSAAHSAARLF